MVIPVQDKRVEPVTEASVLDFIGAKNGGADNDSWCYRICKTPAKVSPPTYQQHPDFYGQDDIPVTQPTVSEH